MQPSLGLLLAVVAVAVAVAAVALAALLVARGRSARTKIRARTGSMDRSRSRLHEAIVGIQGQVTSARASVEAFDRRTDEVDRAQTSMTERLAAERIAMQRKTREQILPAARWLSRLGLLFRIIRLRRNLLG